MFLNFPYILANIHEITNSPVKYVILSVVLCSRSVEAFWLAGCLRAEFPIQCPGVTWPGCFLMTGRGLEASFGSWGYPDVQTREPCWWAYLAVQLLGE